MVDIGHVTHVKPKVWEIRRTMFTVKGLVWSFFFRGYPGREDTVPSIIFIPANAIVLGCGPFGGDLIYFSILQNGVCRERYHVLIELQ